ncbi:hypothetical protein TVAG_306400 [Trichomonas vaginalis G3]|uniref:Uncharacterized protein n=1 Tax=Trichomonas vaginalis (strain ATCC PRA-98 / G3) TaxID=412133 RepID=A2DND0_TRIV3|nr:hypothetical protein TVAGG3_1024550 [Trichomonas vaginalis G3]EAY18118.1 hypothetical protein TVAG_306400 [Trichomonas vaginalis G3]KAI5492395.1 hypothetical protein TVAGG3_1024550 [Trichomonas vaginalis G3]|eukprot:XP_001579104.1 hypothetical protein [Trichomonas vaginalis G3]
MNILTQSYDDYEDDTIYLLEKLIQRIGNENNEIINVSINIVLEKLESIGEDELKLGSIIDLTFDILKYICNDKDLLEKILFIMCNLYSKFNNEKKLMKIITHLFDLIPDSFENDFVMSNLTQICYQSYFFDDNIQNYEISYLVLKCKVEKFHRAKMVEEGRDLAKYLNQNYLELNSLYQRSVNIIISEKDEGKKNEIIRSLFDIPFEDEIERKYIIYQHAYDSLANILPDLIDEFKKRFSTIT